MPAHAVEPASLLVFAGKRVGAALLCYLVERNEPIGQVIAASSADTRILDLCKRTGIRCDIFHEEIGERLAAANERFGWLLNLWSPHVIRSNVLALAEHRLNLHPSLVPHARGSDSSAWTIRKGLPAGVSLINITEVLDEGGVYAQKQLEVAFPLRGSDLHDRLQDEIIALFEATWPEIRSGKLLAIPQHEGGSYHRRKETNADRVREATSMSSLEEAVIWMLAHDFYPGTTAEMSLNGDRYRLRLAVEKSQSEP
jgi:folate-dependent phosphoribosylglycinamide formyltransferase PurN